MDHKVPVRFSQIVKAENDKIWAEKMKNLRNMSVNYKEKLQSRFRWQHNFKSPLRLGNHPFFVDLLENAQSKSGARYF